MAIEHTCIMVNGLSMCCSIGGIAHALLAYLNVVSEQMLLLRRFLMYMYGQSSVLLVSWALLMRMIARRLFGRLSGQTSSIIAV